MASSQLPDSSTAGPLPGPEETPAGSAPRRVFMGWEGPILPGVARLLLDRGEVRDPEGSGGGRGRIDLRNVVVALPVARAGRRLGELLVDEAEARGVRLLPPEVITAGALPERLSPSPAPFPDPVLDRAAWTDALRALTRDELGLLMAEPPAGAGDPGWGRLTRTVRALHRTVGAGGWNFRQVAAACRDGLLFSDEERWRVLTRAQERYREILARQGFLDREETRRRALAGDPSPFRKDLWIVGVVETAPVVRRFLEVVPLERPASVVVPAPAGWEDRFDEWGFLRPESVGPGDLPSLGDRVRVLGDPGDQADAVVEILTSLGPGYSPEDITLGIPDPEVGDHLVERLTALGVPVRTLPGKPPVRTDPFRLLEALADYLEGREYEAFGTLVRHPSAEGLLSARAALPPGRSIPWLADEYHARHLPARLEAGRLPGKPGDAEAREIARVRDALEELLAEFREDRPMARWAGPLRGLLVALLGGRPLNRALPGDREVLEMAVRTRKVLEGMETLPSDLSPPISPERAIRELLEGLRDEDPLPPPGEEGSVEILGWLELALDDAPVLVVTGMNEPHVPDAVVSDPFLPHQLRVRLGLLDNQGRFARDLLHLRTMVETRAGGRGTVVLLAGRRDGEGSPLRLSRLLLGGAPDDVARRLIQFLGAGNGEGHDAGIGARDEAGQEVGHETGNGAAHEAGQEVGHQAGDGAGKAGPLAGREPEGDGSTFRLPPEPGLQAPEAPERISVTRFRRILADPYLYALEAVLHLDSVDDQAREMDPLLFGSVAHAVLDKWAGGPTVASPDAREIRRALDELLDDEVRRRFGSRPLPALRLQAAQLRSRLGAFARWQAGHRSRGWEVAGHEVSPDGEGVPFPVDGHPILLRGRIDRVDHHPDEGRWLLLDYKTGERVGEPDKAHRAGRKGSRRWVDLQLPLYRILARALRAPDGGLLIPPEGLERLGLGYLALPRERDRTGLLLAEWTGEELAEAEETAREVVRLLRENRFVFDPATSTVRRDDPLAPLLGQGILASALADGEGDDEEEGP